MTIPYAQVTKIKRAIPSNYGGTFDLICFKEMTSGKSIKTFIFSNCYNRARWNVVLSAGEGAVISNYIMKRNDLIDADSKFNYHGKNSDSNNNFN